MIENRIPIIFLGLLLFHLRALPLRKPHNAQVQAIW
jgi:hypothetical protein